MGQAQTHNCTITASATEFQFYIDSCLNEVILDVRASEDFDGLVLPGAIHADSKTVVMSIIDTLDIDTPILLYCKHGQRSMQVSDILCQKGFKLVVNLAEGLTKQNRKYFTKN